MKKFKFTINGNKYEVNIHDIEENIADVEVNGTHYQVEVDKEILPVKTPRLVRPVASPSTDTPKADNKGQAKVQSTTSSFKVLSPLPGVILEIHTKVGDMVKVGQKLMVLEAMKMENNIDSDKEGKILSIEVSKGDSVQQGDVLFVIGE